MINILKYKGQIYEVLEFHHDLKDINDSVIVVKLSNPTQIKLRDDLIRLIYNDLNIRKTEYKTESIAIVDNYCYTISDSYLIGTKSKFDCPNAIMCHGAITSIKLRNNYESLSEEDRIIINSMENINKFNL